MFLYTYNTLINWNLYKPTIEGRLNKANQDAFDTRCIIIAISAIASLVAARALFFGASFVFPATLITCGCLALALSAAIVVYGVFLLYARTYELDKTAVKEYIAAFTPSFLVTDHLRKSITAVQELVDQKANLNKQDEKGNYLLTDAKIDVFKVLIDNRADPDLCLVNIVKRPDIAALQYVLENKKVNKLEFTNQQRKRLWFNIPSAQAGQLLKDYGFDIEEQGNDGSTPLIHLVSYTEKPIFTEEQMKIDERNQSLRGLLNRLIVPKERKENLESQIHLLLDCGADPEYTVTMNDKQVSAMDFTKNPIILDILRKRSNSELR